MTKAGQQAIGHINQTRRNLTYAGRWITQTLDILELLSDPLSAQDYDGSRGGGISDPTPHLANVHGPQIALLSELYGIAAQLDVLSTMYVNKMRQVPLSEDERRRRESQCSGGLHLPDFEGWERYCERNWDRKTGENAWLCGACVRRKNRFYEDQAKLNAA